ncbi:Ycf66 family protein [Geminocystis sp. NIES-3709]|uniref:Ycf66 family protein n=1 Tax=Geminocystis sp. NIES-3709 TaxID=1617448 RepID=UPI0005FC5C5F|nr:Ycf66 family protein [Geminocystis sp. NIES-3709]BAQ65269.1 hypothetical protein GM3709_2034 [Geminocystis sp. NIES-3709]
MVNFGFNAASILGIILFLAGGALYAMRSWKPEVSKDHDIFFAAVGLLCGGILFFHGWRLDPILQFSQLLLAGSAIFFAIESVRLRAVTGTQVRGRSSSYVDNDRAGSRVYRAELDQIEGYEDDYEEEEQVPRRRLQGTPPRSTSRRSTYEEEPPRPRRTRPSNYNQEPPVSRNRNNPPPRRGNQQYDDWQETPDHWEDNASTTRRTSSNRPSSDVPPTPTRRSQKRRPKSADDIVSSVGTEYVDYQPLDVDRNNEDYDNPENQPKPDNFDY